MLGGRVVRAAALCAAATLHVAREACAHNESVPYKAARFQSSEHLVPMAGSSSSGGSSSSSSGGTDPLLQVVYDSYRRGPKYVLQRLRSDHLHCPEEAQSLRVKRRPFFAESSIAEDAFKSYPKDYTNTHFDRGHLAPAADYACFPDLRDATFSMANISPQSPSLNKGFWAKLEAWLRFLLTSGQFEEMIILTGPVYAPTLVAGRWVQLNHTIGTVPRLVHVPTHFFKVIVCKRGPGESPAPAAPVQGKSVYNLLMGGSKGAGAGKGSRGGEGLVVVGAFLVPNSDSVDSKAPLGDFVIRLEQLQSLVGFRLLPDQWVQSSGVDTTEMETTETAEKMCKYLDSLVPADRDIVALLSAQSHQNPATIMGTTTTATITTTTTTPTATIPTAPATRITVTVIPRKGKGNAYNYGGGSAKLAAGVGFPVQHVCQHFDCSRGLFEKKK